MAKPYLTLEKWLSVDTELKKIFFEQEVKNASTKIRKLVNQNGKDHYFCTNDALAISVLEPISSQSNKPMFPIYHHLQSSQAVLTEDFSVEVDSLYFSTLKNRFRLFKYQHINKKNNRITKQIILDQKILEKLETITEENNLKSLQNCLEHLIDEQNSNLKTKNKEILELKKELKSQNEKNIQLEKALKAQKNLTEYAKKNINKSSIEYENYLLKTTLNVKIELEKFKKFFGKTSEADLLALDETLSKEELGKIESQFRKDCSQQKLLIYKLYESNTNSSLGFYHLEMES